MNRQGLPGGGGLKVHECWLAQQLWAGTGPAICGMAIGCPSWQIRQQGGGTRRRASGTPARRYRQARSVRGGKGHLDGRAQRHSNAQVHLVLHRHKHRLQRQLAQSQSELAQHCGAAPALVTAGKSAGRTVRSRPSKNEHTRQAAAHRSWPHVHARAARPSILEDSYARA